MSATDEFPTPPSGKYCVDCLFQDDGRCHRGPKVAVDWPYEWGYPPVDDTDWCGEWKMRP